MTFLHFEPCNYDAVLNDTADLSAIRGGSVLLERFPKALGAKLKDAGFGSVISDGGSKLLARISDQDGAADVIDTFAKGEPWRHFTAVWGFGESPQAARNQAAARRTSVWSIMPPELPEGDAPQQACFYDLKRPATDAERAKGGGADVLVSRATYIRRSVGEALSGGEALGADYPGGRSTHDGRPLLFEDDGLHAPRDFDKICALTPAEAEAIPLVVRDKLAVLRLDGIGAGEKIKELRAAYEAKKKSPAEAQAQAEADMTKEKERFYANVTKKFIAWCDEVGLIEGKAGRRVARVDVHMWGGEDIRIFAPAFRAFWIAEKLFELMREEPFLKDDYPGSTGTFPHRMGLAIGQKKVPIRQLIDAADALEAFARAAGDTRAGAISIAVFESAAPPPKNALKAYWKSLYGPAHAAAMEAYSADEYGALLDLVSAVSGEAEEDGGSVLSITQVNRVLRESGAPRTPLMVEPGGSDTPAKLLETHWKRVLQEEKSAQDYLAPLGARPSAIALAQIAQFHPYIKAAHQTLPGVKAAEA
ncbi:MAG: hypothetical protein AAF647_03875 [Pseudomonadota bacterium]